MRHHELTCNLRAMHDPYFATFCSGLARALWKMQQSTQRGQSSIQGALLFPAASQHLFRGRCRYDEVGQGHMGPSSRLREKGMPSQNSNSTYTVQQENPQQTIVSKKQSLHSKSFSNKVPPSAQSMRVDMCDSPMPRCTSNM